MFRAPLRRIRPATIAPAARVQVPRRTISTGPAKKGTWKGTAARWGVAMGAVYFYCTSPLFADDPEPQVQVPATQDEEVTVDKVIEEKRKEIEARAREREAKEATEKQKAEMEAKEATPEGSPQELEEEAGQQGAFNPETGEINWDCPCLGGMAHGPCGEEFRAAFSCFVYSEEEPKGMDCIDKFQGMQDCFRQHPDVYGAELADEEAAEAEARAEAEADAGGAKTGEPKGEEKTQAEEKAQAEEKPRAVESEPTEKAEKEEDRKVEAAAAADGKTEGESQA